MKIIQLLFTAAIIALLSACQPMPPYANVYYGGGSRVREGVIKDIQHNVQVNANTGTGAAVGGITGAVIGSNLGGRRGLAGAVGTIGGAVVGSAIGNSIEQNNNQAFATLFIVRLGNGRLVSVVQQPARQFCIGDHVFVFINRDGARLRLNDGFYQRHPHIPRC